MKKITVAIVDDHKMIREMWIKMFEGNDEFEMVGDEGVFDVSVEMIKMKRPDIVLLDINLQDASGMDAVPLIRKFSPGTRIIAVSMHKELSYAKKMLKMGARAYVTKSSSNQEMFKAIEEVMNDRVYICTEIKDILALQFSEDKPDNSSSKELTQREIEIIGYIKSGHSSREIATELDLSIRTVEVHRHHILKKLNLHNTVALINYINANELA